MKKIWIISIIIGVIVLVSLAFLSMSKPLEQDKTKNVPYPSSVCKCDGFKILGRCLGELIDCSFLD